MIFLFQPLCIYVCRVRNIEVLTGVLNISFFMNDTIDLHPLHWFHLDVSFFWQIIKEVWSQTCTRKRTVLGTPPCTMAPARLPKRSLSSSFSGDARMNGMSLLQETKKRTNSLNPSTERIFACEALRFWDLQSQAHTKQIRYWHGSPGTAPLQSNQAQMRHNETKEQAESTKNREGSQSASDGCTRRRPRGCLPSHFRQHSIDSLSSSCQSVAPTHS